MEKKVSYRMDCDIWTYHACRQTLPRFIFIFIYTVIWITFTFLIYPCRNDASVQAKACLSSIRNRITDMMYVEMASCQPKCSLLATALHLYHTEGEQLAHGRNIMTNEVQWKETEKMQGKKRNFQTHNKLERR